MPLIESERDIMSLNPAEDITEFHTMVQRLTTAIYSKWSKKLRTTQITNQDEVLNIFLSDPKMKPIICRKLYYVEVDILLKSLHVPTIYCNPLK